MTKKRVIITGGSSGLGLELSKIYVRAGYEVICLSRKKPEIEIIHIQMDYTNEKSIGEAVDIIGQKYADFEICIHCTGIGYIESFENMDYARSEETMRVNLLGPTILSSKLLPLVKKNNADILYVWATIGYKANEFMPLYSISKWWYRGLVENMKHELKNTHCRVISISPPWMDTNSNIGENGRAKIIADRTSKPLWSFVRASDIATIIFQSLQTPKGIEMSEIIINRK